MDIYSLAATHINTGVRPGPMSAQAEDRYYSDQISWPPPKQGLLGSIAMTAGVVLILGMTLI
ncbi:hypothetical protein NKI77_07960 [Mesorhizobium opportunistum]|uniref:Uncharacterized protein n=1 Tax=Mesorhizobium opportunistum TaxID=593909 RepID=A0ABV1YBY2_9HYPH|nr:hypothetical protein [Mesorhizobium sp.]TIN90728.1 MAG: hypothetical protein E5Y06_31310 [Mesorhizobium sp.]TJU97908.1 MAG: hypothetical protein E5Y08_16035 [Mesorhizobium sp.]TJV16275.1 MAG: hypothetical protein E5Y07_17840 [Mesorhizobium sp.]